MADQDGSDVSPADNQVSNTQNTTEERRMSSRPESSLSGHAQSSTPTLTLSPTPTPSHNAAVKPEPLVLKIDERQRLARERRQEKEKQNAAKESAWQEREERAKQHYEKHLEDRRRRLEEQRMKEDKRRAAVEEKRRQNLEEEMARHEAVLRRTVERSQRAKHVPNRWSWGGALPGNSPTSPRGFVESSFLYPLDLAGLEHHLLGAFSVYRRYGLSHQYAERRSVSTMNLSKHPADAVINKRMSYSSATLLHSPDRALQKKTSSSSFLSKSQSMLCPSGGKATQDNPAAMRRMQLTPWQSTAVSRLLQPTHSYLARSRSAVSLSGDAVSCHPMGGAMSFKSIQSQPLTPCRGHEPRLQLTPCRGHEPRPPKDTTNRRRTTGNLPDKHKDFVRKSWTNLSLPLATPPLTKPTAKRSQSPGKNWSRAAAPSPGRARPPTPRQLRNPDDVGNLRPSRTVPESLSLIGLQTGGGLEGDQGNVTPPPSQPRPKTLGQPKASPNTDTKDTLTSPKERVGSPALRPTVGTSDPEEATRILAEKRRQAREQKERDDQEKRELEEQERRSKEELAQRKEEEKQRREEESLREEEKRRREEEERDQQEREEAQRQQKQREEEECRQKEEAERQRVEREKRFQKEESERRERKKRLEEIMKRTRRSDQSEKKTNPQKTGDQSACFPVLESGVEHGDHNGHRTSNPNPPTSLLPPADERENGSFEEVLILPDGSRPSPPGEEQEKRVPLIAFRENGMVKPLTGGVEDSLVQHTADVV